MTQTITTSSVNLNPGDVFTITDVNGVNPVTKASTGFAKQFVCISYASNSLVFYPAMIWSGPFQNVSVASGVTDLNTKAITAVGTASTAYRQNMVFHKNAFALAMVPLPMPAGASGGARESYKGLSVRVQPYYDGTNDISNGRAWSAVELNLVSIKAACDTAGVRRLAICEVLPRSEFTDTEAATVRDWNTRLATWCKRNGAQLITCHDAMGEERVATGELDDLPAAYDAGDGIHLSTAGVEALSELIQDQL
jgi:hypothetical protein